MTADLAFLFSEVAEREGDRTALIAPEGRIGFEELDRRAAAFAATCARRGLGRGDRVLLAMPLGIDLFVALAGAWRCGVTVVFPEPAMGLRGVLHAVRATRPRALIASGAYRWLKMLVPRLWFRPLLSPSKRDIGTAPPVRVDPDDLALISFTSGSTGAPKAIPRSHGFLIAQHAAVAPLLASPEDERDLVAFPVFTLVNLAAGRCSVLPNWKMNAVERVAPQQLADWLSRTECTRALLPPALCEVLARAEAPPRLHTVFTGGGPVKPSLVAGLKGQMPGLRAVSVYGSTEAEPIAELDWADVDASDLRAIEQGQGLLAGALVDGLRLRIVDDEIQVAGPHVNAGYLHPSMDTSTKIRDGEVTWHRTGDAGRLDDLQRLWLLGRHAAIAEGPEGKLYPFAVELAAESWPGVRRAALTTADGEPVLAVEGDRGQIVAWQTRAKALGIGRVQHHDALPLDRRHRSKLDYVALEREVVRRR
ncbi:AMP-binding protein [Halovulum sp. GXIMD14794]